jgi:1,4-dihydroxy-2-naphthoate polyprenyltransferase
MSLKIWFKETRPQFLVLSLALVLLGTSIAYKDGYFDVSKFLLTAIGLLLAHASVNVLNDYFDFKSGLDSQTTPTPFSGGSGILIQGLLKPESVYRFGLVLLLGAFFIGIYLTVISGWQLLIFVFIGGLFIYFYTTFLTKKLAGELGAGLGLGTLPVIGTYFIQTGSFNYEILLVSLIPGLLTANLLFLNEFPDFDADKTVNRYNLVIALGKKNASILYVLIVSCVYLMIIGAVITGIMPYQALLALITIIFGLKAIIILFRNYDKNTVKITPALKYNVIMILGINFFLSIGYFLDLVLR